MSTITATFAIDALAARYGFDKDDALRFIRKCLVEELSTMANAHSPARAVEATVEPTATPTPMPVPVPVPRPRPTPKPRKRTPPPVVAEPAAPVVAEPAAPVVAEPAAPVVAESEPAPPVVAEPAAPVVAEPAAAAKSVNAEPKLLKPEMQLPWCGKVLDDRCQAVSFSYGLYTQCMNAQGKDSNLCKTCAKHTNDAGTPKFGFITDRAANPEWTAPDGKRPQRYVQYWSKRLEGKGITREQIAAEAAKFGLVVPESEWNKPEKAVRTRKPKTAVAESSASGSDNDAAPTAAPAPKVKKLTKTKSSPPPPAPIELAPPEDDSADEDAAAAAAAPAADLVHESLANGLAQDPYDMETDEDEVEELNISMKEIDHNDGQGPRAALVDPDGNVYCYAAFIATGKTKKIGALIDGVFKAISA